MTWARRSERGDPLKVLERHKSRRRCAVALAARISPWSERIRRVPHSGLRSWHAGGSPAVPTFEERVDEDAQAAAGSPAIRLHAARLENWGEVMRSRPHYAVSPYLRGCAAGLRSGQDRAHGEARKICAKLDESDAGLIEAAWRNSVYRMLHQHRDILRAHYVTRSYWRATCRALDLRSREYDDVLVRAVQQLRGFCCTLRRCYA